MSEPSKEAVEKALDIVSLAGFTGTPEAFQVLLTALQQLITERDELQERADGYGDMCAEETERAEAAEARVKELMDERAAAGEVAHSWMVETLAATKRAEAAEKQLAEQFERNERQCREHAAETDAVEEKLAELVRRVREWLQGLGDHLELVAILAEYEPKPGEPEP